MSLWHDLDRQARRLGVIDAKLAQGASVLLALIVVKPVPEIMTVNIWWFVGLLVLCAIKPILTFIVSNNDSLPLPER